MKACHMMMSKQLVFFGNERLATAVKTDVPTLRALIASGYEIAAVVSHYEQAISRKHRELEISTVAEENNIPLLLPEKLTDVSEQLADLKADAAILVAYGKIIPQSIIDIFPNGIINIHPSLLPKYRGPTPIETAILDGARKTGVSLMKLVADMDAGPVYAQKDFSLSGNETKQELANKLLAAGSELLVDNLVSILDGSLQAKAQDDSEATYTKLLTKEDRLIDLDKPADVIERQVRAYLGWPKSHIRLFDNDLVVTKARVAGSADDGELVVQAKPGWLQLQELIAPSGKTISGAEFLRGYSKK